MYNFSIYNIYSSYLCIIYIIFINIYAIVYFTQIDEINIFTKIFTGRFVRFFFFRFNDYQYCLDEEMQQK